MKFVPTVFVALFCHIGVHAQKKCPAGMVECPKTPPYNTWTITMNDTYRLVKTSSCPPYDNPKWTNPASACEFDRIYKIPTKPIFAKQPIPVGEKDTVYDGILYLKVDPKPILGVMGVLKNGVDIFGVGSPCGYSSKCPNEGGPTQWVDAVEAEGHTTDQCGGHASPQNQYHVHSGVGLNTSREREACQLPVDMAGEHSELLGWMFDGFGLYGRYSQGGLVPTDLDECGGHTHEIDGVMTYHYHMPDGFPWTIGCYKGCPEVSNNPRELSFINSDPKYGCE